MNYINLKEYPMKYPCNNPNSIISSLERVSYDRNKQDTPEVSKEKFDAYIKRQQSGRKL